VPLLFLILLNDLTLKYMKKTLLFLCTALFLAACNPTTTTTTTGTDTTKVDSAAVVVQDTLPTPDTASTGAVVDDGTSTNTNNTNTPDGATTGRQANPNIDLNAKRFKVTGRLLVLSPYCGGAAPTPDMLEKAKTAQPLANQSLVIRQGAVNGLGTPLVTRTMTDAQGNFSLDLTPGTYCIVLAEKENRRTAAFLATQYYEIDKKCDDKWLTSCDLTFTVADKPVSGLRLTFNRKCNINSFSPCINWGGPLPSSPAPRGK
jgi:hypothetical protein